MASHDMGLASTELRQLCAHVGAVILTSRDILEKAVLMEGGSGAREEQEGVAMPTLSLSATATQGVTATQTPGEDKLYFYSRWTKNYGRSNSGEGVLMRSCFTTYRNDFGVIDRVTRTQVVISAEEYDRVAQISPQSCEVLAALVVGRKSGQQLMCSQIVEDESLAQMISTETGLNQLDTLATILEAQFAPIIHKANTLLSEQTDTNSSVSGGSSPKSINSFASFHSTGSFFPPDAPKIQTGSLGI
jgi:hypothetical protein